MPSFSCYSVNVSEVIENLKVYRKETMGMKTRMKVVLASAVFVTCSSLTPIMAGAVLLLCILNNICKIQEFLKEDIEEQRMSITSGKLR